MRRNGATAFCLLQAEEVVMDYGPNFWRIAGQSLQTEHAAYDDRVRGHCTAGFA
jgi:hypothetical protein